MEELLKKIFFAGVGTMALTYEKANDLVDDLMERGKITVEQGKELNRELKRVVKDNSDPESTIDFATKEDIELLNKRINELEKKD